MERNLDQELNHLTRLWRQAGENPSYLLCTADPYVIMKSLESWVHRKEQRIAVYFALQGRCRASEQERLRMRTHFNQDFTGYRGWLGTYLSTIAKGKDAVKVIVLL